MKHIFLALSLLSLIGCTKNVLNSIDNPTTKQQLQNLGAPIFPTTYYFGVDKKLVNYCGEWDSTYKTYEIGAYFQVQILGDRLTLYINDEQRPGYSMINRVNITCDGKDVLTATNKTSWYLPHRKSADPFAKDSLFISGLGAGWHKIIVTKEEESSQGYIQLTGLRAQSAGTYPLPSRKMAFYGDSYTSAWAANDEYATWHQKPYIDPFGVRSDSAHWSTQEDAAHAFSRQTAIALNAQSWLVSAGGLGFIAGPPGLNMPILWDKGRMYDNSEPWNMASYQADVVFIMLGLNDGRPDSAIWCSRYVQFINTLKGKYTHASYVLAGGPKNSPYRARDEILIQSVVNHFRSAGDTSVNYFKFTLSVGDIPGEMVGHPNLLEHAQMAAQVVPYVKKLMKW